MKEIKPFCFVLMPFGNKKDETGRTVRFDDVYNQIIKPAVQEAGFDPIRADEELAGGIIHKPMFERLMLCDYAVADLTTANANVFYELGIRHGIRPHSTALIFAEGMRLPFDVAPLRALPYRLTGSGRPSKPNNAREALADRLRSFRDPVEDSPLFQLVSDWPRPEHLARLKTDKFREIVEYSVEVKAELATAKQEGVEAVEAIAAKLNILDCDPAIVVDLLLTYRGIKAWSQMVDLVTNMSPILSRTVMVQEQYAFALNRLGRSAEAEAVLKGVLQVHGPSGETLGLLGRVYKDRWEKAESEGETPEAQGILRKAIGAYKSGFETDWRDTYPGINALTLMHIESSSSAEFDQMFPVVKYAATQRVFGPDPDYWDFATVLEICVLGEMEQDAHRALADALSAVREVWEPETTARNLRLIREVRERRGQIYKWVEKIEEALLTKARTFSI